MTYAVGTKGQVVIPKPMRDALGIQPGDRVDFHFDGTVITIEPVAPERSRMGSLAGTGLTQALEAERRKESARDRARSLVPAS